MAVVISEHASATSLQDREPHAGSGECPGSSTGATRNPATHSHSAA